VSEGGKVRQVVVRHVAAAEAGGGEALGARFIMVAYVPNSNPNSNPNS